MDGSGKKRNKQVRKKSTGIQVRALLRPNQPLGTTFEYNERVRALQVTEFVHDSAVKQYGVHTGMFLTEVDDLNVVGLKQGDVVFILQQKASTLREIVFSFIESDDMVSPKEQPRELRSQSASLGCTSPTSLSDDRHSLPHLQSGFHPSLTTNRTPPLGSISRSSSSPISSPNILTSSGRPVRSVASGISATPNVPSRPAATHTVSMAQPATGPTPSATLTARSTISSSYNYGGASASQSSSCISSGRSGVSASSDPFSTPARRRRLVADISKFLLKQYCVKACEYVYNRRVRNRSATVIQCAFRCCMSRRLFFVLLFNKKSSAAVRMQLLYRCWAARQEMVHRIKLRHVARTTTLAIKLQCRFRNRWARRELHRLQVERAELLCRMHGAASKIQCLVRAYLARQSLNRKKKERDRILHIRQRAAVRLECMYRRRLAKRIVDQLRRGVRTQHGMAYRIAQAWRRHMSRRHRAVTNIQKLFRGGQGRVVAREIRRAAQERQWMCVEDELSRLLSEQDVLEIRVDVTPSLLAELKNCSPPELIKWCLRQSMLSFDVYSGEYTVGEVIGKVLGAAQLHQNQQLCRRDVTGTGYLDASSEVEHRVELPALSAPENGLSEAEDRFPQQWGQRYTAVYAHNDAAIDRPTSLQQQVVELQRANELLRDRFLEHMVDVGSKTARGRQATGKALTVSIDGRGMIVVHIENPVTARPLGPRSKRDVLSSPDVYITLQSSPGEHIDDGGDGSYAEEKVGQSGSAMLDFKFKDITVSISITTMHENEEEEVINNTDADTVQDDLCEITPPEDVAEESVSVEDDVCIAEDSGVESEEDEVVVLPAPVRPSTATTRPSTATTRLKVSVFDEEAAARALREAAEARRKLEEEEQELMALRARQARSAELTRRIMVQRIQRAYRRHVVHVTRVVAAILLQRVVRRRHNLHRWHSVVAAVWELSTFAVVKLQSFVRRRRAVSLVHEMRVDYCAWELTKGRRLRWDERLLRRYEWAPGGSGVDDLVFDCVSCEYEKNVRDISDVFAFTVWSKVDEDYRASSGVSEEKSASKHNISNHEQQNSSLAGSLWYTPLKNTCGDMLTQVGNGQWAAELKTLLQFPDAPAGCIQPSDIVLVIPTDDTGGDGSESAVDIEQSEELLDDSLDSAYGSWRRLANPLILDRVGVGCTGQVWDDLGDVRPLQRRVNLSRYKFPVDNDDTVPPLYRTIAANFSVGHETTSPIESAVTVEDGKKKGS